MKSVIPPLALVMIFWLCGNAPLFAQADAARTDSTSRDTTSSRPSDVTVVDVDEYPKPIKQVPPVYPIIAQMRKITGKVLVKVLVGQDGVPMMAKIYRSDAKELDEASIESVMKWRFKPAMLKGVPVEFWVVIPFVYNMRN